MSHTHRFLTGLAAALALAMGAGAAAARDYVVVASTAPAITRGQGFEAGARVSLAAGQSLTLMHASGDVVRIKGAAGGVLLPRRAANQGEADRLAILKVIVAPAANERVGGMRLSRTRSGICPEPATVRTLDAIVQTHQAGCRRQAAQALDTWIAAQPPIDAS
ncbi:MAG: hypothetical protein U1C74_23720 [Phenylobacterium sp.]|nr:hypothetical protein [Phenylobacterium sp.]